MSPMPAQLPGHGRRYISPNMKLVDLFYAGRLTEGHPSLAAIAQARVGDAVTLRRDGGQCVIVNDAGQALGRMSEAFQPPDGRKLLKGEVAAILERRSEDNDEAYRHQLRRSV